MSRPVFALTVRQPWASLLLLDGPDRKDVENRSWPPPSTLPQWHKCGCGHRIDPDEEHPYGDPRGHAIVGPNEWTGEPELQACGPGEPDGPFPFLLGIHAGLRWDKPALDVPAVQRALLTLGEPWMDSLIDVLTVVEELPTGALLGHVTVTGVHKALDCLDAASRLCSPWADWRRADDPFRTYWHWQTADPVRYAEPIPMRGRQRLWRIPDTAWAVAS